MDVKWEYRANIKDLNISKPKTLSEIYNEKLEIMKKDKIETIRNLADSKGVHLTKAEKAFLKKNNYQSGQKLMTACLNGEESENVKILRSLETKMPGLEIRIINLKEI